MFICFKRILNIVIRICCLRLPCIPDSFKILVISQPVPFPAIPHSFPIYFVCFEFLYQSSKICFMFNKGIGWIISYGMLENFHSFFRGEIAFADIAFFGKIHKVKAFICCKQKNALTLWILPKNAM